LYDTFKSAWCCCCRRSAKRDDLLFEQASKKLTNEIDLLKIIKKLRDSTFMAQIYLKPHQQMLIKFFDEYKIKIEQEKAKEANKLTDSPRNSQ